MEDKNMESTGGSFASRLRGSWDDDKEKRNYGGENTGTEGIKAEEGYQEDDSFVDADRELSEEERLEAEKAEEEARKEAERLEKEQKRAETIQKIKTFLYENKDALILSGQLAVVALVCVVGIKNDLLPEGCCKKKRKKRK